MQPPQPRWSYTLIVHPRVVPTCTCCAGSLHRSSYGGSIRLSDATASHDAPAEAGITAALVIMDSVMCGLAADELRQCIFALNRFAGDVWPPLYDIFKVMVSPSRIESL